jgi:tRNA threonylcarbamoyladenosine biosynthesis protein TsaB
MSGSGSATWMLCLDASAPRTCVALGRVEADWDELQVIDELEDRANQTSTTLEPRLRAALATAGIVATQLGAIACGRGPGTFTGSRVAVATAKGLALGLGLPIVPVSTLAALAGSSTAPPRAASAHNQPAPPRAASAHNQPAPPRAASAHNQPAPPRAASAHNQLIDGRVLALLDARREQVYAGVFEVGASVAAVGEEQVIELAGLVAGREDLDELVAIGPGVGAYAEQLPASLRERSVVTPGPTAVGLWRAAVSAWRAGVAVDAGAFSVCYLRESYAEMGIHKPKRPPYVSPFVG